MISPARKRWPLVAAAILALAAAVPFAGCEIKRHPAGFPHRFHLVEKECSDAPAGGDSHAAPKSACLTCLNCHDGLRDPATTKRPTDECRRCHAPGEQPGVPPDVGAGAFDSAVRGTTGGVRFPHAKHLADRRILGQCVLCHRGIVADGQTGQVFPGKPVCLTCHQDDIDTGNCPKCHRQTNLARTVPRTFMRHDQSFIRSHGPQSTRHGSACSQCHAPSFCTDCHDTSQTLSVETRQPESVDRTFLHRGNFVNHHSMDARSSPARCFGCHSTSSCDSCHVERGISASRVGSATPHPPGWVGRSGSGDNAHGERARRDIVSCAVCHDQGPATNCISCHKVGSYGGNPHPGGWQSSRSPSSAMCRYCHAN